MTAASSEWQPGDPLMPDNGCGTVPAVLWSSQERREAIAEDDVPPPWFRPFNAVAIEPAMTRHCEACSVTWRGDMPCWSCGGAS